MSKYLLLPILIFSLFWTSFVSAVVKYSFKIYGNGTIKACSQSLSEISPDSNNCRGLSLNIYTADSKPLIIPFSGTLQQLRNNQGTGFNIPFTIDQGQAFKQITPFYGSDQTGTWQLAVLDGNGQQVSATKTITVLAPAAVPAKTSTGTTAPVTPKTTTNKSTESTNQNLNQNGFSLTNPFKGGDNLIDLISVLANFIFNLGVPVAVIMIVTGGIRLLISGGNRVAYEGGLKHLRYALEGLAILLIGKGFVSLIQSILGVISK